MLPASRRRQEASSVHPQRGTKAFIRHWHKDHDAEWKLVPAASSRAAQVKSQRAEALVEALFLLKNYRSTTLLFLLTWYALGVSVRENTLSQ